MDSHADLNNFKLTNHFKDIHVLSVNEKKNILKKYKDFKFTNEQVLAHPILSLYVNVNKGNQLILNKKALRGHVGLYEVFKRNTTIN